MEQSEVFTIPFTVHESDMARMERQLKRLWIALIMTIIFLVATNAGWIIYESQFEEISMTQEANTDGGGDVIVNGVAQGDLYYGASETNDQSTEAQDGR